MNLERQEKKRVVIGVGQTGQSCMRFFLVPVCLLVCLIREKTLKVIAIYYKSIQMLSFDLVLPRLQCLMKLIS